MKVQQQHLTDEAIQEFATNRAGCSLQVIEHMQHCAVCLGKAAVYEQMASAIQAQAAPAFDFDVAALVMPQLPPPVPAPAAAKKLPLLPVLLAAPVVPAIPIYVFSRYTNVRISGNVWLTLYFLMPVALVILLLHVWESYKQYQKQLMAL
jgi:hypothetical protein